MKEKLLAAHRTLPAKIRAESFATLIELLEGRASSSNSLRFILRLPVSDAEQLELLEGCWALQA